jgi:putative oxidoreductase
VIEPEAGARALASLSSVESGIWSKSMNRIFAKHSRRLESLILLGSRLLLSGLFLHEAVTLTANFDASAAVMAKLGVPIPVLAATIAVQGAGGLAIALGWGARSGAAALGLFCLATALLFHTNFALRNELLHFEKDFAIAGGMFALMIRGAGAWSLEGLNRARRRVAAMA